MPVTIRKNKDGSFRVSTPNAVHAKHTSRKNALAQKRIIEQAERKKKK